MSWLEGGEILNVDLTNCVGFERFSKFRCFSLGGIIEGYLWKEGKYVDLSESESQALALKYLIDISASLSANEAQATRCAVAIIRGYGWYDRSFVFPCESLMDELNFDFGLFADPRDGDGD